MVSAANSYALLAPVDWKQPTFQILIFSKSGELSRHEYYRFQELAESAFDALKESFARDPQMQAAHLRYLDEVLDTVQKPKPPEQHSPTRRESPHRSKGHHHRDEEPNDETLMTRRVASGALTKELTHQPEQQMHARHKSGHRSKEHLPHCRKDEIEGVETSQERTAPFVTIPLDSEIAPAYSDKLSDSQVGDFAQSDTPPSPSYSE